MSRCGIVILAAGASTRMGVAKQSLEFEGSTLLMRAVETAMSSVCRPIVVVLGARAAELEKTLVAKPVQVVVNSNWAAGMGTSIRAGVSALRASGVDAVMIFLCDQPLITSTMLDQMVAAHFSMIKAITAAHYSDTFGTPVIFSASLMHELSALEEGQGGKAILSRHPDQVAAFALPEAAVDVDTAEDFDRLLNSPNRDL